MSRIWNVLFTTLHSARGNSARLRNTEYEDTICIVYISNIEQIVNQEDNNIQRIK